MPKDIDVLPRFEAGELSFRTVSKFRYQRSLSEELELGLSAEQARRMLKYMFAIRSFEEMIVALKGGKFARLPDLKFVGATHLSIGQEAVAVGAMAAIRPQDYITSTHRGHGHSIAKGAFYIEALPAEELAEFADEPLAGHSRGELLDHAIQMHLNRTMAELLGKEEGYCRGRGGGMHIADFHVGHLGANAIVGGSMAIAAGAALACDRLGNGSVVLCLAGDGAANNGIAHEAYNFACMDQFARGCPVIFLIENNQYGMTGQQVGEVTGIDHLARRGAGYNEECMHAEVVDGMDVLAVHDAVSRAADICREGHGPVLLECLCYRYMGHSLSDSRTSYRSREEEQAWLAIDPLASFERQVVQAEVMTGEQAEALRKEMQEAIEEATVTAAGWTDPDPADMHEGLYSDSFCHEVPAQYADPEPVRPWRKTKRDSEGQILYRHAVAEAIAEEMLRDSRVVFYGEDVADYGGAFQATRGLLESFGRERVFNTAISEACIAGSGGGAAMVGLRPVVELMYIDFILMAMDQVGNQVAKARYMFGGKARLPLVIRTTIGGGKGYAGQHSQSLEAVVTMFPGLKVALPATAYDVKGLLKTAIRDDNPVVFIEHQHLYVEKGHVPEEEYLVPFGEAVVRREGDAVTIVAYSWLLGAALEAAELAAREHGIECEVIDPRTLVPLDLATIVGCVGRTGRLLCVAQAPRTGCFPEHIVYKVQEQCFAALKAPARIVAAYDVPPPMAQPLETENIPSPEKIARAIHCLVEGKEFVEPAQPPW
ncbi:MAG: pyruvate dehydrogenase complex E1 component subunit beta [Armatimonadota bacterium]